LSLSSGLWLPGICEMVAGILGRLSGGVREPLPIQRVRPRAHWYADDPGRAPETSVLLLWLGIGVSVNDYVDRCDGTHACYIYAISSLARQVRRGYDVTCTSHARLPPLIGVGSVLMAVWLVTDPPPPPSLPHALRGYSRVLPPPGLSDTAVSFRSSSAVDTQFLKLWARVNSCPEFWLNITWDMGLRLTFDPFELLPGDFSPWVEGISLLIDPQV
jgi:hypothetical protein